MSETEHEEAPAGDEEDEGGKPMTFWEHLDELRTRLIRAIVALFVGCIAAWTQHERLLAWLQQPLDQAWKSAERSLESLIPLLGSEGYEKLTSTRLHIGERGPVPALFGLTLRAG